MIMMMMLIKSMHTRRVEERERQSFRVLYVKNILFFLFHKRFGFKDDDQTKVNGNVCHSFIVINVKRINHHCWW